MAEVLLWRDVRVPPRSKPMRKSQRVRLSKPILRLSGRVLLVRRARLAAAQNGAKVVLVEKSPTLGISFQTSKGNVSIYQGVENEEFWQFVSETTDTMDEFLARFKKATETGKVDAPYPDYDRVKALMQASCETVNWVEKTGIDFIQSFTKEKVGTDTVWPDTSADASKAAGQLITEKMTAALEDAGVEILLEHEATELVTEDGKVTGRCSAVER